jgi:copper chaperone CopZ
VQSALSKVPGVKKAEVALPDKAVVTFDKRKVKTDQLIAAVKKAGYGAKEKKEKIEKSPN